MFTNWRTSLTGFLAFAPTLINAITPIIPAPIAQFSLALFGLVGFFLAKDHNVSGTGK